MEDSKPYGIPRDSAKYYYGSHGVYFKRIAFDNGYAVSIVSHRNSYGGHDGNFEVAVMCADNNQLVYDSPITNDVLGHLDFAEVAETIEKVRALPNRCFKCNPPKGSPGYVRE
jgi:hypothetical protein